MANIKVTLKRTFFGPDGSRYRAGEHSLPASWKFPKSAQVGEASVEDGVEPAEPTKAPAKPATK